MTPKLKPILLSACLLARAASAAIVVPGANGTDGTLNITTDTVIDLSQAPTGSWDQDNTANAGKGVYDPAKWAVVFKYTSVSIASGKTVTFKNHASRAPVIWLVSGNVTIAGTVDLSGQNGQYAPLLAEPGPGGFRGGVYAMGGGVGEGAGFGPGGGGLTVSGGYGTRGGGGAAYGNPALIPLIGGSGGGGKSSWWGGSTGGGGGGGAILIAVANACTVNGAIQARGGAGPSGDTWGPSGGGSGGAIRIVSESLSGTGGCFALGGASAISSGGVGRIRLERQSNTGTIEINPAPSVVDLSAGATALLWPPSGSPEARVISIGAVSVPSDPRAAFGTYTPDVALPLVNTTEVIVETVNVEQVSQVKVRITPRDSANFTEIDASYSSTISLSPLTLRWTATLPTKMGHSAIQARIIRP